MNNKVNIGRFIRTIEGRSFSPVPERRAAMFLFNRSGLAVCLALVVAAFPVLVQFL
jgi:hypothetical protein